MLMRVKLIKKIEEAKGTKSFYFQKPKDFEFLPGQYIYLTLPKLDFPDTRGATRHFTISLSPTEIKKEIRITCRIREESGFKKTLDALPIGTEVEIEGPSGTFIFDEATNHQPPITNHIFLAGGIGITPFRSFIKYNLDNKLKIPMHLIYSNSNSDFVFGSELKKWSKENDFIKVDFFDTSVLGHLDASKVRKIFDIWHLKFEIPATWWLVGPPAFVSAMEEVLESLKIPSSNIISEKFTGY